MEQTENMHIVLAIIFNPETDKILIARRENDPLVAHLTWCFPGARIDTGHDMHITLGEQIKQRTGIDIEPKGTIYARTPKENKHLTLTYLYCEYIRGREQPAEPFKELKWIKPTEVRSYFTTSLDPHIAEFLQTIEESWK